MAKEKAKAKEEEKEKDTYISCKLVDFTQSFKSKYPQQWAMAYKIAYDAEKTEYEENRDMEDEPAEEALKSEMAQKNIEKQAHKLMLSAAEIPMNISLRFEGTVDVKSVSEKILLDRIEEKYHLRPDKIGKVETAHSTDILRQKSSDSVYKMLESNDYKTFLELKSSIKNYSFNNICMIYGQNPDVKAVKSCKTWGKFDRRVIKGEHGLEIWRPNFKIVTYATLDKEVDAEVNRYICVNRNEYKYEPTGIIYTKEQANKRIAKFKEKLEKELEEHDGKIEKLLGYRIGHTFDISQTVYINPETKEPDPEHDNIADILNLDKKLSLKDDTEISESVLQAVECATGKLYTGRQSTPRAVFDYVYAYAEERFKEPYNISGIKSMEVSKGIAAECEKLIATAFICDTIGIEGVFDDVSFKMTKFFDGKNALEDLSKFDSMVRCGGRVGIFQNSYERGFKLAEEFRSEFEKVTQKDKELTKNKKEIER